ncbi:hypothetical protein TMatcc_002339 [Talaromyces marneffei ATCC 18224]|uniref:Uncharacterized protein n=1 Tax=Talaromyces marneffei (strain ATCC 18224 / CBS 334.59 / QM 7333) TaxID=441960 RepID=B6QJJ5_TALMQ|nr:uncharacterized protein EYB26_006505 [Talaromyces marneffei]EEA23469.1 conserved hypothetical protein [Talaromyces marneffei ATCC 18224]KAE8552310.1 hypothetical protein EYB25_006204 [Talaromyces marneffei]QGA18820.1 hypothetical protein EYB26_006505 [Talaromyces marneffei]
MAASPEILVHVGAPSAVSDDAGYRALVEACLAFEPVSRQSAFCLQDNNDRGDLEVSVDILRSFASLSSSSGDQPSFSAHHHETVSANSGDDLNGLVTSDTFEKLEPAQHVETRLASPGNTSQLVGQPLPSISTEEESELSFQPLVPLSSQTGTGNTPNSPEYLESASISAEGLGAEHIHNGPSTWETPLDVIPDSQQDEQADQTTVDDSIQVDRSFVPDSARQSKKYTFDSTEYDPDNDITRIPSSVPSASPKELSANIQAHMTSGSPLREKSSNLPTIQANPSISASVLGKRKAITTGGSSQDSHIGDAKAQASAKSRPNKRPTLPQATGTISLDNLPIEIRAPHPPVSNDKFRTHITPTLETLAERMKQSSRFTPKSQNRELRPLERGYWFLPCITIVPDASNNPTSTSRNPSIHTNAQIWTQTFFSQFWSFLRDFFTEGRAGWGIWCLLEQDSSVTSTGEPKIVTLKLYTWGEVAPHLYLLLFLATERRIKKMKGVVWRDATDEDVIIMS